MIPFALCTAALFSLSSLVVALAVKRAPAGYQDAEGFHFGIQPAPLAEAVRFKVDAVASRTLVRAKAMASAEDREVSLVS